jgi:dTDP-4-dehydrorhamnose reductase
MRLLVTGARGQLGWELTRSLAPLGDLIAVDRQALDLAQLEMIAPAVRGFAPDVIVNAAAYTAVDRAEEEHALACRINGDAVGILADEAARSGALLIHYSTDYVFDGRKTAPYREDDSVAPLNAYGRSKLQGEAAIQASSCDWLVFRTTWVYAARGNNFLCSILRLAADRDSLRIVADQHGAPTAARYLADMTAHIIRTAQQERAEDRFSSGLYHMTASGSTTWHGFATAIVDGARRHSHAPPLNVRTIEPIMSHEYPTAALRPANSMLDNAKLARRFALYQTAWQDMLKTTLEDAFAATGANRPSGTPA